MDGHYGGQYLPIMLMQLLTCMQGVLPAPSGVDNEAADGRNNVSDQGTGVRELELQIDSLYGLPSYTAGNTGESPIRGVQARAVNTCLVHSDFRDSFLSGMKLGKVRISFCTLTWYQRPFSSSGVLGGFRSGNSCYS